MIRCQSGRDIRVLVERMELFSSFMLYNVISLSTTDLVAILKMNNTNILTKT